ncbi:hypothetical protein D7004_07495 [Pedobacter jejuensis]|uniref:Uncharacterized protein n=2 Tax=Pedobacter jejuensis TaxID=1268550 RepID=A0A3N0BYK2_9SPHI|nr:hypothetical protein D7004_07495 [Pedobacter jejuensis]
MNKSKFMLQQFTWPQFLLAAFVLSLVWYVGVVLIFYRKELKQFLSGGRRQKQNPEPLPHRWDADTEPIEDSNEETLMGEPQLPQGMTNVSMGGFGFAVSEDEKEEQFGLVPDVLEEIKSVFNILSKEDGNKKDFFSLMKLVSAKYPMIGSNPNIERINEYITDHAPFHLSAQELQDLWD